MTDKIKLLFLSALLLAFSSCISRRNIEFIDCTYSNNGQSLISESVTLHATITTTKGIEKTSKKLNEFNIVVNGGTRRPKTNIIDIGTEDYLELNKRLQVFITVKKKPWLTDTIDFIVDHQGEFRFNFDGQAGGNAGNVHVDATLIHDQTFYNNFNCEAYLVKITSQSGYKTFFMSENNSSLFISNRGGNGYNGAPGAPGARGANGKDGLTGFQGRDGSPGGTGGAGGDGGDGGNGGAVILTVNKESLAFADLITIDNRGGSGGHGGIGGPGGPGGDGGAGGERLIGNGNRSGGAAGSPGPAGSNSRKGSDGLSGPPIEITIK